jgi:hypothetical protein
MITVPATAPDWAQRFARDVQNEIERVASEPRPLPTFKVATKPAASKLRGCSIWLSDSAGNRQVATSNGTDWYYSDGTAA